MRKQLKAQHKETDFRLRGLENTRIESLSDGVFALAIALLLISSDFPETFADLKVFMEDFIPFGGAITLLVLVWYQHYLFFIRYGLKDGRIVAVNTFLLFLILFYVYPLKFLFKILYQIYRNLFTGDSEAMNELFTVTIPGNETPQLMVIYGIGAASVFLTLALMYYMAWKRRDELELNPEERHATRTSLWLNITLSSVPIISTIIAATNMFGSATFIVSGFAYTLYFFVMPFFSWRFSKKKSVDLNN